VRQCLAGVRIVDLSRVLAGPFCTMVLADLGADVIKVEPPHGDDTREWGPPFAGGESAYFLAVNRNKRSMTLDLKTAGGRQVLLDVVARCDAVIENFRPGTLDRLGIGYDQMRAVNPRLVYCMISGFGAEGPSSGLPGYDPIIEAMGGLMSITGEPDGQPVKVGVAIIDVVAALFASTSILAALRRRDASGLGERVDIAPFDTELAALANVASSYLISRQRPHRHGNAHPSIVPFDLVRASDRYLMLGVGNDRQWRRLCEVAGLAEFADDPRFATNRERVAHREDLMALLRPVFARRTADEWSEQLMQAGVPSAPVNTLDRVFDNQLVKTRDVVATVEHPTAGPLPLVASPLHISGQRLPVRMPPPLLGQHTHELVAGMLAYTSEQIARLSDEGAFGAIRLQPETMPA
jgi:formyl-CoA transferase